MNYFSKKALKKDRYTYRLRIFIVLFFTLLLRQETTYAKFKKRYNSPREHDPCLFEQYQKAKETLKQQNYLEAKKLFEQLKQTENAPLTPYIHFYYAVANYHQGEIAEALTAFKEIYTQFPQWNKQDEILYWITLCNFQTAKWRAALETILQIKDKGIARTTLDMKKHFLHKIENCQILYELVQQFPNDETIKHILIETAHQQAYATQDFSFLNQLYQTCDLKKQAYDPLTKLQNKRKNTYHVAVFLPFFTEELNYATNLNQGHFVIDLYQGMQMAIKELATEGTDMKIFTFDTKKDTEVTKKNLAQDSLTSMDLIIGPLYPNTIPLVSEFSRKHKINLINPISTNSAILKNNPFAFLFQPSAETLAQKAAQLTINDLKKEPQ